MNDVETGAILLNKAIILNDNECIFNDPYEFIEKKYCTEYQEEIVGKEAICKCGLKKDKHEVADSIDLQTMDGIKVATAPTDAYGNVKFKGATRRTKAKVCL